MSSPGSRPSRCCRPGSRCPCSSASSSPPGGASRKAEAEGAAFLHVERGGRRNGPESATGLAGFAGLCALACAVDAAGSWLDAFGAAAYACMAIAAWLVWREAGIARRRHFQALRAWGWQLLASALALSPFCLARPPPVAIAGLAASTALALVAAIRFLPLSRAACALMTPAIAGLAAILLARAGAG